jgi:hypothetical protein
MIDCVTQVETYGNNGLLELEVDCVTYHMLFLNQCLSADRIEVLVDFLGYYRHKLDKIPLILNEEQLDKYYARLFESESIHKFLIFMLDGCTTINQHVDTLQNTIIGIKQGEPDVLDALRRFTFEYSFSPPEQRLPKFSAAKFKVVISSLTANKLDLLFDQSSSLHRFSRSGALTIAAEIHGKFMRSKNGLDPTGERLYLFQDGMDNVLI